MMNFPDSPAVGQTFSVSGGPTYTYDGSKWRVLTPGNQFNRTTFTATAGQTVFTVNYTLGAVDVFQNGVKLVSGSDFTATNGTSITLTNAATVGDTIEVIAYSQVVYATAAKAEDVYSVVRGMKNRLINGAMQIWQRGTSFTGSSALVLYSADRWMSGSLTSSFVASRSTSVPTTSGSAFQYSLKMQRTAGQTSTNQANFIQAIESVNCYDLAGLPFTLSFWAKCGANYSPTSSALGVIVTTGTVADEGAQASQGAWTGQAYPVNNAVTLTTTWQKFTLTGTFGSGVLEAVVYFYASSTGTAGADDSWYITGVQLEAGAVTNPVFERRPYGAELQLCQRYFQTSYESANAVGAASRLGMVGGPAVGYSSAWTGLAFAIQFKTYMRADPTIAYYDGAGNASKISSHTNQVWTDNSGASGAIVNPSQNGFVFGFNSNANWTVFFHYTASAEL